jgi:hypothetical protein
MARVTGMLFGVALLCGAAPLHGQQRPWHDQWFWGAEGGVQFYETPTTTSAQTAVTFGGHWLITGSRMGLLMSYDQILYNNATSVVSDPTSGTGTRSVQFDNGRYIQADLLAMPLKGPLQVMLGAGITIHSITDATVQGTFAAPGDQEYSQSLANDAATRAFFNMIFGFNLMLGSKAAFFAHYEFVPSTKTFLINSEQHNLVGGLRYSFGSRKEDVTTER